MTTNDILKTLLMTAWLLPLLGFVIEIFGAYWSDRKSKTAAKLAVFCIAGSFVCSSAALWKWGSESGWAVLKEQEHHETGEHAKSESDTTDATEGEHPHEGEQTVAGAVEESSDEHAHVQTVYSGEIYTLGKFGDRRVSLDYYIDSLTLVMFVMVTFIATCIHIFSMGYMSDELTDDYVDHFAHTKDGKHVHRPGRYYRFFAFMSLFCFSMLGLVLAGNIFQVFVFWELVGICSYLLIGFYTERKSASNAANKAFIMNRVGDFGFLIGLMVLWTWFGTFQFGDTMRADGNVERGLFSQLQRDAHGEIIRDESSGDVVLAAPVIPAPGSELAADQPERSMPWMLLVVAGLGVFAGCIGKSAQFPLQTWLPDAMEGPTPVSALVHSATMVAAGVYLVGRFYPMFTREVLLTIAYVGCITLFLAATIAVVATDIKKVLAYSTISQLGYMMLGLGVFGWGAGLFHLITHAFFKSLMFLSSGSVIHGCHHEQEMPKMGGLWRKMPVTAFTMGVGVIAISGLAIPGTPIAFSGFYSKDAIVATALAFINANPVHFLLFLVPLITAGITAFYMWRLWFYTFWGQPRDEHIYEHAHESPAVMIFPLIALSFFAAFCAWGGEHGPLYMLLTGDQPSYIAGGVGDGANGAIVLPGHAAIHDPDSSGQSAHDMAGLYALLAAVSGTLLAWAIYAKGFLNPADIRRQFAGVHQFLVNKWQFDELYDALFVRPAHVVGRLAVTMDRVIFDGIIHGAARVSVAVSVIDRKFDEGIVDGFVDLIGNVTFGFGRRLRGLQTGRVRQYVMFIALGVIILFALLFTTFPG